MRKWLICLALGLLLGLFAYFRWGTEDYTVRLNIRTEPSTTDPRLCNEFVSKNLAQMLYEGLTRYDSQGPTLALAKSIETSADGLTVRIELKPSKWSDGSACVAGDFINSYRQILDPSFAAEFADALYILKNAAAIKAGELPASGLGARALDDLTLELTLERPCHYIESLLAFPTFFPTKSGLSNGPFLLDSRTPNSELVLKKNPLYWDADSVSLSSLQLTIVADENTELAMFLNDELDFAGSPYSNLPLAALEAETTTVHTAPLFASYLYLFNTREFPFTNTKMRQAFCAAVNRQSLISNVLQGCGDAAYSCVPHSDLVPDWDNALNLFEEALSELGITRAAIEPLVISYNSAELHQKIAESLQQRWSEIFGIKILSQKADWKVHLDQLKSGHFQIGRFSPLSYAEDAEEFLLPFASPTHPSGWNNAAFKEILAKLHSSADRDYSEALLKAETILMNEAPCLPIFYYEATYLQNPKLEGVILSPLGTLELKKGRMKNLSMR